MSPERPSEAALNTGAVPEPGVAPISLPVDQLGSVAPLNPTSANFGPNLSQTAPGARFTGDQGFGPNLSHAAPGARFGVVDPSYTQTVLGVISQARAGTFTPENLSQVAAEMGFHVVAATDLNNLVAKIDDHKQRADDANNRATLAESATASVKAELGVAKTGILTGSGASSNNRDARRFDEGSGSR